MIKSCITVAALLFLGLTTSIAQESSELIRIEERFDGSSSLSWNMPNSEFSQATIGSGCLDMSFRPSMLLMKSLVFIAKYKEATTFPTLMLDCTTTTLPEELLNSDFTIRAKIQTTFDKSAVCRFVIDCDAYFLDNGSDILLFDSKKERIKALIEAYETTLAFQFSPKKFTIYQGRKKVNEIDIMIEEKTPQELNVELQRIGSEFIMLLDGEEIGRINKNFEAPLFGVYSTCKSLQVTELIIQQM